MAKRDFEVAVAFAPQSAEGVFDATLDAAAATLSGVPGGTDDGLLLGDPGSGILESGLDIALGRESLDKALLSGSFTRPLSDYLRTSIRTFSYSFPFCGNRGNASTPAVDADFRPLRGMEALLNGAGLVGAAYGSGVGWSFQFGSPQKFSSLVYVNGLRLELLDCTCSGFRISYTPGGIPIATADIAVGSIKDPTDDSFAVAALPTLDYGPQATESAPVIESVGNFWEAFKGFSAFELAITQDTSEVPDSNSPNGVVVDASGRTVTATGTLYEDDANGVHEARQVFADSAGDLDALLFNVGAAAGDGEVMRRHGIIIPAPEVDEITPNAIGDKAANEISFVARSATANEELTILFQ